MSLAKAAASFRATVDNLMEANRGLVYFLARKYARSRLGPDEDDLLQEARIGLWKGIQTHDPARGRVGSHLAVHITNRLNKAVGRRSNQPLPQAPLLENPDGVLEDALAQVEGRREQDADAVLDLPVMLARLPAVERRVVEHYFLDSLTLADVAEAMGISDSWASELLRRGLARLRRYIERELGEPAAEDVA